MNERSDMNERIMSVGEGRAAVARPSLRVLLLVGMLFGAAAATVPAAQAAAPRPLLIGTEPASPSTSLTPQIRGDADGVITSVVASRVSGPIGRTTTEPGNTVTIYTDNECLGPVAASGDAEELEGSGILVAAPVPPDSETTFYATETNLSGTSACSNGIVYQQVTTPPAPPIFNAVTPASGANDNFPYLTGSSAPNSIVFLYADASCSTAPVASGPAAAFAAGGIQVQVPDNSNTTFHAEATLAGLGSGCSGSAIAYQEVTPPESPSGGPTPPGSSGPLSPPRLRTIPGGIANDTTPLITGSAPGAALVKIFGSAGCKGAPVAKGSASQFAAGLPVQIVPNTTVTFYGKSVGSVGNESACSPTPVAYTDDSIAPRTRITAGPGIKTLKHTVVFRFTDITGGFDTSFLCKVDRRPWKACHAPFRLKRLGHKRHVLHVKAYDAAGNHEKRGVKRSFQVIRPG